MKNVKKAIAFISALTLMGTVTACGSNDSGTSSTSAETSATTETTPTKKIEEKETNVMKLMIASDIHGSAYYCLEMLDAMKKECPDRLLLLGDILYQGPRYDLPLEFDPN